MSTQTLEVTPSLTTYSVVIPAEAQLEKERLLKLAADLPAEPGSDEELEQVISVASHLKGLGVDAEDNRKTKKDPFWNIGVYIDTKTKEFRKEIDATVSALETRIGVYRRRKEDQEAAARAALAAIDAMECEEDEQPMPPAPEPEPVKIEGVSLRSKHDYTVTDVEALYAWDLARRKKAAKQRGRMPLLTILSMELRKSDFKALLMTLDEETIAKIPGVTINYATKETVRAVQSKFNLPA